MAQEDDLSARYLVGPHDVLSIVVTDQPDLTGDATVDVDGTIVLSYLNQILVASLDVQDIREKITRLLAQDFLHDPVVKVTVKDYRSQKVEIFGDIGNPGVHYLAGPTRLRELLIQADGVSGQLVNPVSHRKVRITKRQGSQALIVDLYDLLVERREEANILLRDGYAIFIPRAVIQVAGEVKNPGFFPYEDGLMVLKAITLAGGFTRKAAKKKAIVMRHQDGKFIEIKVGMEDLLQPDDYLEIPLSFW